MKNFVIALCLLIFTGFADARTIIGSFSAGNINNWESKIFKGETRYRITKFENETVLKAESEASASGLFREKRIDLYKTPFLNWRWQIKNRLKQMNEQEKSGDDYVARVYVVISGGWTFWRTRAINYVWAVSSPKGKIWPNAFAGENAMMMAVRSANDQTNRWFPEKRNVLEDLKQVYGEEIRYIDAVALMTDTDNSKGNATAYYGDIYFTAN